MDQLGTEIGGQNDSQCDTGDAELRQFNAVQDA